MKKKASIIIDIVSSMMSPSMSTYMMICQSGYGSDKKYIQMGDDVHP